MAPIPAYAFHRDGAWHEISGPFALGDGDGAIHYPANWTTASTPEELAAIGVLPIIEPSPPSAGQRITGSSLIDFNGQPKRQITTASIDLAPLRQAATETMNASAGAFRRRFITDIPGQQATYLAKEAEARDWTVGSDPADFPYLACEAAATGQSVADIAALVMATAAQWRALDPKIEGARRGATVAIGAANSVSAITAAATVDWDALLG